MVASPDQLRLAWAYVAGELDVDGDIYAALSIGDQVPQLKVRPAQWATAVRLALDGAW